MVARDNWKDGKNRSDGEGQLRPSENPHRSHPNFPDTCPRYTETQATPPEIVGQNTNTTESLDKIRGLKVTTLTLLAPQISDTTSPLQRNLEGRLHRNCKRLQVGTAHRHFRPPHPSIKHRTSQHSSAQHLNLACCRIRRWKPTVHRGLLQRRF